LTRKDLIYANFGPFNYKEFVSAYPDRNSNTFVSAPVSSNEIQVWDTGVVFNPSNVQLPINITYYDSPGDILVDTITRSNSIFALSVALVDTSMLLIASSGSTMDWKIIAEIPVKTQSNRVSVRSHLVAVGASYDFVMDSICIFRCRALNTLSCDTNSWVQEIMPATFPPSGVVELIDDDTLLCVSIDGMISIWKYDITSQTWVQKDSMPYSNQAIFDINQNHLILQGGVGLPVNLYSITSDGKFGPKEQVAAVPVYSVAISADSKYVALVTFQEVYVYRREETWVLFQTMTHQLGRYVNSIGFTMNNALVYTENRSLNVYIQL